MKNISIIGVGKLGLCLGLNLEKVGYNVLGVDVFESYVNSLNNKTFVSPEPFVNEYLRQSKNIEFTTEIKKSLENDIIFIVVDTPSTYDYKYDHKNIDDIAEKLISFGKQKRRKDLIINCTTFPGYSDKLQERLKPYNYFVSYNPEFIAQGSIIMDQQNCDNVLIGEADVQAGDLIQKLYSDFCVKNPDFNRMTRTEAEITKISVNCFLTTKISYANMIGDIALRYESNPDTILKAIGTDSRIGSKYLNYGYGFGGPCFPRDNRALAKCAEEVGIDAVISKATDIMNEKHLEYQIDFFKEKNKDKTMSVQLDYITYKKESVSIEESQQLKFAIGLKESGYKVKIKDQRPEVIEQIQGLI
jgi:nucleotide sugar dehydrogenase